MQFSSSLVLILSALALAASPHQSLMPLQPTLPFSRRVLVASSAWARDTALASAAALTASAQVASAVLSVVGGRHGLKFKNKQYHHANAIHHNAHATKVDAAHKINAAAAKSIAHHHHNYKAKVKFHKEHFHAGIGGHGGKGKMVYRSVGLGNFGGKGAGLGYSTGFHVDPDRVVKVKKIKHHNNNDKARAVAKAAAANVVQAAAAHQARAQVPRGWTWQVLSGLSMFPIDH